MSLRNLDIPLLGGGVIVKLDQVRELPHLLDEIVVIVPMPEDRYRANPRLVGNRLRNHLQKAGSLIPVGGNLDRLKGDPFPLHEDFVPLEPDLVPGKPDHPFDEILRFVGGINKDDRLPSFRRPEGHDPFLGKRDPQRISEFIHKDVIPDHQGGDHRSRGDLEGLDHKRAHDKGDQKGRQEGLAVFPKDPLLSPVFLVFRLPVIHERPLFSKLPKGVRAVKESNPT